MAPRRPRACPLAGFAHSAAMLRAAIASVLIAAALAACDRKPAQAPGTPSPTPTPKPTPVPTPTPPPPPTPVPTPYVPMKSLEIGKIFSGIEYHANLETIPGTTATTERTKQGSYVVEVNVKVTVPK